MLKKLTILLFSIFALTFFFSNIYKTNNKAEAYDRIKQSSEDKFAIWTSTLDGKNIRKLASDPNRQMTHIRVSPDNKWFMFTRYNNIGKNGCATEAPDNYNNQGENYLETEILIGNLETLEIKSVIKPKTNQMSANSYWSPDGNKMLYVHVPQNEKRPIISIATFDHNKNIIKTETLKLPDFLLPVDPHQVGNKVVFPATDIRNMTRGLWLVNIDGSNLKQITFPKDPKTGELIKIQRGGDNDPKISPDGRYVAFMRNAIGRYHWHIFTVDLQTGVEKDLSQGQINDILDADAIPEWSSDGKLISFWSPNGSIFDRKIDIGVMKPDGSGRKKITLPEGNNYQSIAFFPGYSSQNNPKIIFSIDRKKLKCNINK